MNYEIPRLKLAMVFVMANNTTTNQKTRIPYLVTVLFIINKIWK